MQEQMKPHNTKENNKIYKHKRDEVAAENTP